MATFSQAQNENTLIHRGKVGNDLKPELSKLTKAAKRSLGERSKTERKALGDLSNVNKPVISTRVGKNLSSASKSRENMKSTQKSDILTEEQKIKCQKWAQEGIEYMHFTGNDIQKLDMDCMEKSVEEEVAMAMSSLHGWGNDMFDLMPPSKDGVDDSGLKLEFEPEILPSRSGKVCNELKPEISKLTKTAKRALAGGRLKTERKALGDLSNVSKPLTSARDKEGLSNVPKYSKSTKSTQKSNSLTEERIKKCQEWAQEGIERMHFTQNDIQKVERDCMEKRVQEEVAMVMSSMHEWGNDMFDLVSPMKDGISDSELNLEFELEILPPKSDKGRFDESKLDCLLDESESAFQEMNLQFDLKLKAFPDTK